MEKIIYIPEIHQLKRRATLVEFVLNFAFLKRRSDDLALTEKVPVTFLRGTLKTDSQTTEKNLFSRLIIRNCYHLIKSLMLQKHIKNLADKTITITVIRSC